MDANVVKSIMLPNSMFGVDWAGEDCIDRMEVKAQLIAQADSWSPRQQGIRGFSLPPDAQPGGRNMVLLLQ